MLVRALLLCRRREGSRCSHVCRAVHWLGWRLACRCSSAVHVESSVLRRGSAVPYAMTHDDGDGVSLRVWEHGVFVGFRLLGFRVQECCVWLAWWNIQGSVAFEGKPGVHEHFVDFFVRSHWCVIWSNRVALQMIEWGSSVKCWWTVCPKMAWTCVWIVSTWQTNVLDRQRLALSVGSWTARERGCAAAALSWCPYFSVRLCCWLVFSLFTVIDVIDSCDRFRFSMITSQCHTKGECGALLLQLSVQERKWEGAVRHVFLFCKEQAVNDILAIDVDGSYRSVRFGSREGMCTCIWIRVCHFLNVSNRHWVTGERSDVVTRTLEERQTSFKEHDQSILNDEIGKPHADDVEVVGCERMTKVLEESTADLHKSFGEGCRTNTGFKKCCADKPTERSWVCLQSCEEGNDQSFTARASGITAVTIYESLRGTRWTRSPTLPRLLKGASSLERQWYHHNH